MALALISARLSRALPALTIVCMTLLTAACTSPLELDVDRDIRNLDRIVSPTRLSLFYYFGDQSYEAIVINQELLNSIKIDKSTYPCKVTIPQFLFTLSDTMQATPGQSPLVRTFSFSCIAQPADGFSRNAVNKDSWMAGDFIDITGAHYEFKWMADNAGKEISIGYYTVPEVSLVKGFVRFLVIDPATLMPVTSRALLTMEY